MKKPIERRQPRGFLDYFSIAFSSLGVGYMPIASGTFGSMVGVAIYLAAAWCVSFAEHFWITHHPPLPASFLAWTHVVIIILLLIYCLVGIWAAGRSTELFGDLDPSKTVVDEVMGQLITFLFIPFTASWILILAGFLLFRLFDIWKPYPIDSLQDLPAGIGVCADDILAGVYAGACLAVVYAVMLSI